MFKTVCKLGLIEILILLCIQTRTATAVDDESSSGPGVLYFGFFFNELTASSMKNITDLYFNALSDLPEFSSFIHEVSFTANVTDPHQYYIKPLDPNSGKYDPLYHTTAKYCGYSQAGQSACAQYEKDHLKAIDTEFEMHLIGYVLTPKTFGIRVDLTNEQRELFDEENGKTLSKDSPTIIKSLHSSLLPGDIKCEEQQPFPPTLPATATKAHVTIGCAPGVAAVVTGHDALQATENERNNSNPAWISESWYNITDPIDGKKMKVTLFKPATDSPPSNYTFVIYPRVKLLANANLTRYFQKSSESSASKIMFDKNHLNLVLFLLSGTFIDCIIRIFRTFKGNILN